MIDLETDLRGALADAATAVRVPSDSLASYRARVGSHPTTSRLGLSIAGAVIATVAVIGGIIALVFANSGSSTTPAFVEGVERTLTPHRQLTNQGLRDAASILNMRLAALGVHGARITPSDGFLDAHVPAASVAALTAFATTKGVLRFRQALELDDGSAAPGHGGPPLHHPVTHAPEFTIVLARTYANWDCSSSPNPTQGHDAASDYIVACSTDGSAKYLLAPTAVSGSDIDSVTPRLATNGWVVDVTFDGAGSGSWQKVTQHAYNVNGGMPQTTTCRPPKGCNAVAITLDGAVMSAPYIASAGGISGGRAEISGGFNRESASRLAAILKSGALPTTFAVRKPATQH